MRALAIVVAIGCGGSPAPPPKSELARNGIVLGVVDATHGGHEPKLRASAKKHVDAIRNTNQLAATNVEVSLVTLDKPEAGTLTCAIQIVVLGGGAPDAVWRGTASAAYPDGPAQYDEAVGDCVESVIGDLVDQRLAALVAGRLAK